MSSERDLQSKIAALELDAIVVDAADETFSAEIIDTLGMRNITLILTPSRAITPLTETMYIVAEDSPDGVTYTDVDEIKFLPTRNFNANGQLIFNATAPYHQTIGLTSVQRYLKIGINCTQYAQAALTMQIVVVMEAESQDFLAYDPGVTGDGMP